MPRMEAATTRQPTAAGRGRVLVRQVALPGRDPRGACVSVPAARRGRAAQGARTECGWLRDYAAEAIDPRAIEEQGWVGDELIRDLGERGFCGLYVAEEYGGQGLSQTGYCRVFETHRPDRRLALGGARRAPVDRLQGHRAVRQRRAEGPAPARPGRGPPAGGVRAHRARGRLGRLQPPVTRGSPAGRLLAAQRREALDRQRLQGLRAGHFRPRRGRRQGPPHRADRRARHGGLRGRQALRHDGPARQRPAPPLLPRRAGAEGERARRAGRGLQDRHARAQQRAAQPRHWLGGRRQGAARRRSSTTSRSGASSAARWPTSSSCRTRSAGWSPTCSGSSRSPT